MTDEAIIKKYRLSPKDKILDVGGSMKQHKLIQVHTLVDIVRPEKAPYFPEKLRAQKFIRLDITKEKMPFGDNEFDFCLCTHTLEDLFNPFLAIEEMSRVAKRGLIITPSFGKDIIFSHLDMTDWLTGSRRVPGHAHHKWLFCERRGKLQIMPKNYPILYSSKFHFTRWLGEEELMFSWQNKIEYEVFSDLNTHKLIDEYIDFMRGNRDKLRKGFVLFYFDNPIFYFRELAKIILKRGEGFKYRNRQ